MKCTEHIGLLLWQEEKEAVMDRVKEYINEHDHLTIENVYSLDFVNKADRSAFVRKVYEGEEIPDDNPKIISDASISFVVIEDKNPEYAWATTGSGKRVFLNTNSSKLKAYTRELYHWKYLHSTDDYNEFISLLKHITDCHLHKNIDILQSDFTYYGRHSWEEGLPVIVGNFVVGMDELYYYHIYVSDNEDRMREQSAKALPNPLKSLPIRHHQGLAPSSCDNWPSFGKEIDQHEGTTDASVIDFIPTPIGNSPHYHFVKDYIEGGIENFTKSDGYAQYQTYLESERIYYGETGHTPQKFIDLINSFDYQKYNTSHQFEDHPIITVIIVRGMSAFTDHPYEQNDIDLELSSRFSDGFNRYNFTQVDYHNIPDKREFFLVDGLHRASILHYYGIKNIHVLVQPFVLNDLLNHLKGQMVGVVGGQTKPPIRTPML